MTLREVISLPASTIFMPIPVVSIKCIPSISTHPRKKVVGNHSQSESLKLRDDHGLLLKA
jgi:hypothetical protein